MSFLENAGCALSAGGLAALIGNPADLALIRMQVRKTGGDLMAEIRRENQLIC